jgi:hypothetical protein
VKNSLPESVDDAYKLLKEKDSPHQNLFVICNCKTEAGNLLDTANDLKNGNIPKVLQEPWFPTEGYIHSN